LEIDSDCQSCLSELKPGSSIGDNGGDGLAVGRRVYEALRSDEVGRAVLVSTLAAGFGALRICVSSSCLSFSRLSSEWSLLGRIPPPKKFTRLGTRGCIDPILNGAVKDEVATVLRELRLW
jgi:hypothetical protein